MTLEMKLREVAEEARIEGKAEGKAEGIEEGLANGRRLEVLNSVAEKDYSPERGAEKLGISVEELLELMKNMK